MKKSVTSILWVASNVEEYIPSDQLISLMHIFKNGIRFVVYDGELTVHSIQKKCNEEHIDVLAVDVSTNFLVEVMKGIKIPVIRPIPSDTTGWELIKKFDIVVERL